MIPPGKLIDMHYSKVRKDVFVGNPDDFADYLIFSLIHGPRDFLLAGICADASDVPVGGDGLEGLWRCW